MAVTALRPLEIDNISKISLDSNFWGIPHLLDPADIAHSSSFDTDKSAAGHSQIPDHTMACTGSSQPTSSLTNSSNSVVTASETLAPSASTSIPTIQRTSDDDDRYATSILESILDAEESLYENAVEAPTADEQWASTENLPHSPFQKWLKSFRQQKPKHRSTPYPSIPDIVCDGRASFSALSSRTDTMTRTDSWKGITVVKTASVTLPSISISARSTQRKGSGGTLDPETVKRMRSRKSVLEELINTEEYYVADLKVLIKLYIEMINKIEGVSAELKHDIKRNVSEILALHERLLGEIYRVIPAASHQIKQYKSNFLDVSPHVSDIAHTHVLANPVAAQQVAKVFDKMISGFFVYEEYSAKYEMVTEELKQHLNPTSWPSREKGCETLASMLNSTDNQYDYGKRALTLGDMLVKPIQRICRYPLLFGQILDHTPAIDCPESNRLLAKVRAKLDETAQQINGANRQALKIRDRMEKTSRLQDRLVFRAKPDFEMRYLGYVVLCGTLHVVWHTPDDNVAGEYMACLLYKSYLLLATVSKTDNTYTMKFAITLATARIEKATQGPGFQCNSSLNSWKIIFEADHRIYEVVVTAISPKEEEVWRKEIDERITAESRDYQDYRSVNLNPFTPMTTDIRPLGQAFGRPGTLARSQSLHRAGNTSAKYELPLIIIHRAGHSADIFHSRSPSPGLNRSSSLVNSPTPRIFALKRSERNHIETKMHDVWSKDLLPFATLSSGSQKRAQATMAMRMSMANLVSNVARKSRSKSSLLSMQSSNGSPPVTPMEQEDDPIARFMRRDSSSPGKNKTPTKSRSGSVSKRAASLTRKFSFSAMQKKENVFERKSMWRRSTSNQTKSDIPDISISGDSPALERFPADSARTLAAEKRRLRAFSVPKPALVTRSPEEEIAIKRKRQSTPISPTFAESLAKRLFDANGKE
ncbi:hypothetical protein RUND412_003721 [Rhizina undulata]